MTCEILNAHVFMLKKITVNFFIYLYLTSNVFIFRIQKWLSILSFNNMLSIVLDGDCQNTLNLHDKTLKFNKGWSLQWPETLYICIFFLLLVFTETLLVEYSFYFTFLGNFISHFSELYSYFEFLKMKTAYCRWVGSVGKYVFIFLSTIPILASFL